MRGEIDAERSVLLSLPGHMVVADGCKSEDEDPTGPGGMAGRITVEAEAGSEKAVRFTPPSYPARLESVKFFIPDYGVPGMEFGVRAPG